MVIGEGQHRLEPGADQSSSAGARHSKDGPTSFCPNGSHPALNKRKQAELKYRMFHAAADGCLPCVQHFIETMKVNPDARSDTCCWTVADWALEAAAARGKSTAHVRAYMREKWGQCPSLAMSYSKKKGISAKGSPEVENAASVGAAGAGSRAETSVSVPAAPLPAQPLREASAVHAKPQGNG